MNIWFVILLLTIIILWFLRYYKLLFINYSFPNPLTEPWLIPWDLNYSVSCRTGAFMLFFHFSSVLLSDWWAFVFLPNISGLWPQHSCLFDTNCIFPGCAEFRRAVTGYRGVGRCWNCSTVSNGLSCQPSRLLKVAIQFGAYAYHGLLYFLHMCKWRIIIRGHACVSKSPHICIYDASAWSRWDGRWNRQTIDFLNRFNRWMIWNEWDLCRCVNISLPLRKLGILHVCTCSGISARKHLTFSTEFYRRHWKFFEPRFFSRKLTEAQNLSFRS